jgi:riboflavin synthase
MFTGLVEEKGRIAAMDCREGATTLTIAAQSVLEDTSVGDSVAVDGTCLTATSVEEGAFCVDLAPETLARTAFNTLVVGSEVNLERPLSPTSRLGGHFVQGHIDTRGEIRDAWLDGESRWLSISYDPAFAHLVVPKGFVAVDGVSLTVVDAGPDYFTLMLIPHTRRAVTLGDKQVGDPVNLEFDILGKYLQRHLEVRRSAGAAAAAGLSATDPASEIEHPNHES